MPYGCVLNLSPPKEMDDGWKEYPPPSYGDKWNTGGHIQTGQLNAHVLAWIEKRHMAH